MGEALGSQVQVPIKTTLDQMGPQVPLNSMKGALAVQLVTSGSLYTYNCYKCLNLT